MKIIISENLRQLRGKVSQAQTANMFGIAQTTYSGWENPHAKGSPDASEIVSICKHYGVSSDWLLGLSPHRHIDHAPPPAPVEYGAARAAETSECPGCVYLKAQLATVNQTLHNLSLGRSQPARTSVSGPVKY